jgi:hypothetical protein
MMSRLPRRGAAPDDRDTLWRAAFPLFIFLGEARRAEAVIDRALMLNPNAGQEADCIGPAHARKPGAKFLGTRVRERPFAGTDRHRFGLASPDSSSGSIGSRA